MGVELGEAKNSLWSGRYIVGDLLGRGGMGTVVSAFDRELGITVAVKRLHSNSILDKRSLVREFRTVRDVRDPGLVCLHDLLLDDHESMFTMELVRGQNLGEWMTSTPLAIRDPQILTHIVGQLRRAVSILHTAGIVHGDIKPQNILVETGGRLVLTDFGLSHLASQAKESTGAPGTPGYTAPELFTGVSSSPSSDSYALGVIICQLLTNQMPTLRVTTYPPTIALPEALVALSSGAGTNGTAALARCAMTLLASDPEARLGPQAWSADGMVATAPARARVVGRDLELRILERHWRAVRERGSPSCIQVIGESGAGKTTLLRAFADAHRSRSSLVSISCHPCETVPFRVQSDILESLAPSDDDHRVYGGLSRGDVADILARAIGQPTIIIIDDAQWADADSAEFLRALQDERHALPILLVVATRQEPGAEQLLSSARVISPATSIKLRPIVHGTAMAHQSIAPPRAGDAAANADYRAYLSSHHPDALDVATLASLAGGPIARQALVTAIGRQSVFEAIDALCRAGILERTAQTKQVAKARDAYADGLLAAIPSPDLKALHARLAIALAAEQPDALALRAHHLALADDPQQATPLARQAAQQFEAQRAYALASTYYQLAWDQGHDTQALQAAADCAVRAGLLREAAHRYILLSTLDPDREATHGQRAADLLMGCGEIEEARDVVHGLVRSLGISSPRSLAVRIAHLIVRRIVLRIGTGDPFAALHGDAKEAAIDLCWTFAASLGQYQAHGGFQAMYLQSALRRGDPARIMRGQGLELIYRANISTEGREFNAIEHDLRSRIDQSGPSDSLAWAYFSIGFVEFMRTRMSEALAYFERSATMYEQCDHRTWEYYVCKVYRLICLLMLGRIDELVCDGEDLRQTLVERGLTGTIVFYDVTVGYVVDLQLDRPRSAISRLKQASTLNRFPSYRYLWRNAMTVSLMYAGHARAAGRLLVAHLGELVPSAMYDLPRTWVAWYIATTLGPQRNLRWHERVAASSSRWWLRRSRGPLAAFFAQVIDLAERRRTSASTEGEHAAALASAHKLELRMHYAAISSMDTSGSTDADSIRAEGILRPDRWNRCLVGPALTRRS